MSTVKENVIPHSLLTEHDIYFFREGTHYNLYEKLGSHPIVVDGVAGTHFAVWAPNAKSVHVIGNFNGWNRTSHPLFVRWDHSGIWEGFIPHIGHGEIYKYFIHSHIDDLELEKGDPFAFRWEEPPRTASVVWDLSYDWNEGHWEEWRQLHNSHDAPIAVYEMHYGSWKRIVEEGNRPYTYKEMAEVLPGYLVDMGFTHVEFMPLMEHPFFGSWGYQKVGYFAPSSRYGTPQDFMDLITALHQKGIGIILDWVPSHFPSDLHGLARFDGSSLFEHHDPRKGFHPEWKSYIFNYGRYEVKSFLISSADFWFRKFHVDGLRVDAVSSMLYLDYARQEGEWIPNIYNGRENLEALDFIRKLNEHIYLHFPHAVMTAEESTAWPMVSRPTAVGGLGFGMKWCMGWMHDTLMYFSKDPIHRKYHHSELLFSLIYIYHENFVLPLSHDEVVHGKGSLLRKMPGDDWQKFANLRLLFSYMYAHPGKKLLFMGSEIGPWDEWSHEKSLDWHLLQYGPHQGIQSLIKSLNRIYREEMAFHELDFNSEGFEWVDIHDADNSIISFLRRGKQPEDTILVVCNFTPVPRIGYGVGVPYLGFWKEIFNSDSNYYGGTDLGNQGGIEAEDAKMHLQPYKLSVNLPPLGAVFLKAPKQQ
ncbi:MAG: 1,4-alpha-glucan branching protein GlgB [Chlamydiales bacterium]